MAAAAIGLAGYGAGLSVWNVITVCHSASASCRADLLGRGTSSYRVVGLAATPLGAAGGVVAKAFGLHAPYLAGGAVLCTLLALPSLRVSAAAATTA